MDKDLIKQMHEDAKALQTRRSLLSRLKNWEDHASWQEFFNLYWKFIYSIAIKSGLSEQEAEDAVQETILSIAKTIQSFEYKPEACSFKGWLMRITRLRIIDQFRKRPPRPQNREPDETPGHDPAETSAILEQIPDPSSLSAGELWEEEWKRNLVDAAMERIKDQVNPEHYQIFYLAIVKKMSPRKVAALMGVSAPRVYLARHRVAKLVKKEIRLLEEASLQEWTGIGPFSENLNRMER